MAWGDLQELAPEPDPALRPQERSAALPQTMSGSELPSSPTPASSSQPSASEPGKTGQNSWQAPSKTCCRTGSVWHFQKLLNLSLALSFPALGCCAFKNRHVPSTSTLLLEVQEPQDGFHVPCGPAAVTGLCPGETPPRSCPLHSFTAFQLPTQVSIIHP